METQIVSNTVRPGQEWIDTQSNMIYLVVGFCKSSADESDQYTEVMYRSHDMPPGCYLYKPITDWFTTQSNGYPAFLPYYLLSQERHCLIRSLAFDRDDEFKMIKQILLQIFKGIG